MWLWDSCGPASSASCKYHMGKKLGTRWGHVGSVHLTDLAYCLYLPFIDACCFPLLWMVFWRPWKLTHKSFQVHRRITVRQGCGVSSGYGLWMEVACYFWAKAFNCWVQDTLVLFFLLEWLRRPCVSSRKAKEIVGPLSAHPPHTVWHKALHWSALLT